MLNAEHDLELAICGAGPVGLALAALLVKRGVAPTRLAVLDGQALQKSLDDPRSIALSFGSQQILQQIGAWPLVASQIEQIHVSRQGHFGRTLIDRHEHHLPALGYVTRYGQLVQALAQQCEQLGVTIHRPVQVLGHSEHADHLSLQIQHAHAQTNTAHWRCQLMVQAEGGVFGQISSANKQQLRDYAQTAIVAEVQVEQPQLQRAFERFTDSGPLALLPLAAQQNGAQSAHYSLVWCVRPAQAQALLAADDAAFLAALGQAFGQRLGAFCHTSPRQAFPLGMSASLAFGKRSVGIGNAAQTLHPVAGQGLNLGLRDASVLARLLSQDMQASQFQHFLAARAPDRSLTMRLTDTMARIFTKDTALPQSWLGLSLGLFDMLPPARHHLAQLMMFGHRQ